MHTLNEEEVQWFLGMCVVCVHVLCACVSCVCMCCVHVCCCVVHVFDLNFMGDNF